MIALVIVVGVLLGRRWALARDLLLALVAVVGIGILLGGLVESDWLVIEPHVLSRWGFPELRIAARSPQSSRWPARSWSGRFACSPTGSSSSPRSGAVVLGAALPSDVLGALALGLGAGALVRLAFGTAAGVPPAEQVRQSPGLARRRGGRPEGLDAATNGLGRVRRPGPEGRPLKARVLGRDAQDTQKIVRRWRALAYRDPPRSVAVGRLEQVEHEALATLLAAQAGVRVPEVVTAASGPDGDALVVTREPDADPLEVADGGVDETLRSSGSRRRGCTRPASPTAGST